MAHGVESCLLVYSVEWWQALSDTIVYDSLSIRRSKDGFNDHCIDPVVCVDVCALRAEISQREITVWTPCWK